MLEFYKTTRLEIERGDFPFNHDCILKVCYIRGSPVRFTYFSCRSQDSGQLTVLLSSLPIVSKVYFSSVDELPDDF